MSEVGSIVFFGTPAFAVPTLAALVESGERVARVFTQPARPAGRGRKLRQPPVAEWALERGLEVEQPERVRRADFIESLEQLQPDLAVVIAFGQIFPQALLDVPRHGCINVHASLLPRWRGASPISAAIAAGDRETGISTMVMEAGLDSGPVLLQDRVEIGEHETCGELTGRLSKVGARTLLRTVQSLREGTLRGQPQDENLVTLAPMLQREDAWIDWSRPAQQIYDRIRAHDPWPGSKTGLCGRELQVRAARPSAELPADSAPSGDAASPGTLLGLSDGALLVACGEATMLRLESVQRPNRKAVRGVDLWNGERLAGGERFDAPPDP